MARYSVELKPSARKELEKLPGKIIERIFPKLEALELDPRVQPGARSSKADEMSGGFASESTVRFTQ